LRQTSSVTLDPDFSEETIGGRSAEREMSLPSSFRMTSPGSMPACAPGPPFSTEATSAPVGDFRPKFCASA
jgi:hypothetical protein